MPTKISSDGIPALTALGFDAPAGDLVDRPAPGEAAAVRALDAWARSGVSDCGDTRNLLARPTSRMSQYLHFGCVSPLRLEQRTRDHLQAWKDGRTGFPVVDAGMRQLVACGWMHNRARMIVASFLTKDLHVDWRAGEAFFMEHLIDGDVGSNNGGWQWVAGTGTDPQDYTRVFNPALQQERFDPDGEYVRRWVPEHGTDAYPEPIVDHARERRKAIADYRDANS